MKWEKYISRSGKSSGVTGYITGKDYITIKFRGSEVYTYTYITAGKEVVEKMKQLAKKQQGLSTFISQFQPPYQ